MNKEIANILDKATPYLFGDEVDKLLNYIEKLENQLQLTKFYIEQSDIKDMLWGKEILKIIGDKNE
jgi:hypothetical protein